MNQTMLPQWLDDYIFKSLQSTYQPQNRDMLVVDWDRKQILTYLGTYFPRTFAESYSIYSNYIHKNSSYLLETKQLSIFDFGCGTGGEIIGLLTALNDSENQIETIKITALDGNNHSLHILESLIEEIKKHTNFDIELRVIPIVIDDFYDMSLTIKECLASNTFDIIMSFKAVCEFVTKQQFEENNPYEYLINTLLQHLKTDGIMCFADVTSYNGVAQEWLPKMLDSGISATDAEIIAQNNGYNESYYITHSHKQNDLSKIAWRILKHK